MQFNKHTHASFAPIYVIAVVITLMVTIGCGGSTDQPTAAVQAGNSQAERQPLRTLPLPSQANFMTAHASATALPEVHVVVLEGGAYDRGLRHGQVLKLEISELMGRWKYWIKDTFNQEPTAFIAEFLSDTHFLEAAEKWKPEVVEEVRGIADGAGVPFSQMFAFQLIDEMWAMGADPANHHCSTLGVNRHGDQPTIVAQNLDLPHSMHGSQTLLHIKMPAQAEDVNHKPLEILAFTVPGIVAANGLNNYGVAVACNTVLQLKPDPNGLPVDFVVRGMLDCRSREEAVEFARSVRHASGQNYIIGGGDEAWCLECSQDVVTRFEPSPGCGYTYHTNHPVVNENYTDKFRQRVEAATGPVECARFASLQQRLMDPTAINEQLIRETLASKDSEADPICNSQTYGSLIMVLGEKPYLLLAPGSPDSTEYERYDFEN